MLNRRAFGGAGLASLLGLKSFGSAESVVGSAAAETAVSVSPVDYEYVFGQMKDVAKGLFGDKPVVCNQENMQAIFDKWAADGNYLTCQDGSNHFPFPVPFTGKVYTKEYDSESDTEEFDIVCSYFKNGHLHREDGPAVIGRCHFDFHRYGKWLNGVNLAHVGKYNDELPSMRVRNTSRSFALNEDGYFEYLNQTKANNIIVYVSSYSGHPLIRYRFNHLVFEKITRIKQEAAYSFGITSDNQIYGTNGRMSCYRFPASFSGDDKVFPDGDDGMYSFNQLVNKYRNLCEEECRKGHALVQKYRSELPV